MCAVGVVTALAAYAHARHYVLRRREVIIDSAHLPYSEQREHLQGNGNSLECAASQELRILHFSDFHALARHRKLRTFVRGLRETNPDILIFTGDFISEDAAIPQLLGALEEFRGIPGFFVFGSNDYFKPQLRNPFSYLLRNSNENPRGAVGVGGENTEKPRLATKRLVDGLRELGFIDLTNTRAQIEVRGLCIDAVGVDDPHIDRDQYPSESELLAHEPCLRIGVVHAPYTRVLDRMADDGCSLIFSGHTHGGQVCLPGHRALVTNCDLPAHLVSGLFMWPPTGEAALKGDACVPASQTWVQVSAGLGTTPFVPLRTWCAPEAIEMTLRWDC